MSRMSRTEITQETPAYHHLKHPGGRLTKIGGQAVSLAPQLGQVTAVLGASVSRIALGAVLMLVGSAGIGYAGSCTGGSDFTCSGAADPSGLDTTQALSADTVTTTSGFGIDTTGGTGLTAFNLTSYSVGGIGGSLTFTDNFASPITASGSGIVANHTYGGALSITSTGSVSALDGSGISALNSANGTDLTINAARVTGSVYGIVARNEGTGATSITSTGTVLGGTFSAINARNFGTDLTIHAATVAGASYGILARNYGSGALSVSTTGPASGASVAGVRARNYASGTDLTINAAAASGGLYGIDANNQGTGALTLTATQTVSGTSYSGVIARNNGTDLTINTAAVSGGSNGIFARNYGTGALSVTASGTVSGTASSGISAINSSDGTDLSINATTVTGGDYGVFATNSGTGALSITTTGAVTGSTYSGMNARNFGTDMTINTAAVTGGSYGIIARNYGSGALSITTSGDILGNSRSGINARNFASGTSMTINTAKVTGTSYGIIARNYGTEALSITATGDVTGQGNDGIFAQNFSTGADLSVSAAAVTGNDFGINAVNEGTGALSVFATGQVTGTSESGISATNSSNGAELTINAAAASGGNFGIVARNEGSGALLITATDAVSGGVYSGINARNFGTDMTVNAASATGGSYGVIARNYGSGALSISTSGDITGNGKSGINARNFASGTSMTINTAKVTGSTYGIIARNYGTEALSITATGDVTGQGNDGVFAHNFSTGSDLSVSAAAVTGNDFGINALNEGSGALSVTATGAVSGVGSDGVRAVNSGTNLSIAALDVSGAGDGINAVNNGSGTSDVTVNGTITGGTGAGINVFGLTGAMSNITLNDGANVSSASGLALQNDDSDSIITLNTGSTVTGDVLLADGSDVVVLAGGDISGVTLLDGGDDTGSADGFIDILRVTSSDFALSDANLINWELLEIDGGSATFSDADFTIGDGSAGTGVSVLSGGVLSTGASFTLNAPLSTAAGGIFDASGGGSGAVTINGDVANDGILTSQDGVAGDVIIIAGDYTGSGVVGLDTVLNDDASASDLLEVQGDTSGSSILSIENAGGGGDVTSLGIEVISVAGTSGGDFSLAGDYVTSDGEQAVIAGAYAYTLVEADAGSWRLQSESTAVDPTDPDEPGGGPTNPLYQPGAPIYDSYAQSLLALNGTSSFRHRGSSQDYRQLAAIYDTVPTTRLGSSVQNIPSPFWFQLGVGDIRTAGDNSTTGAKRDGNIWEFEVGADTILSEGDTGFLVAGVIVNHAHSSTNVTSDFGSGAIDTRGTGLTLAATWYDYRGFYVDGQLKYSRYNTDLTSSTLGALTRGNNGSGYAFSLEFGKEYQMKSGLNVIPQAQLTKSTVDFDSFTGPSGEQVALADADSLLLRLGVEVDQYKTLEKGEQRLYALGNIFHEFGDGSIVDVSGVSLANSNDDWAGEIGFGGSYTWDDSYSIFGEATYATGLSDIGDSTKVSAIFGFRMEY